MDQIIKSDASNARNPVSAGQCDGEDPFKVIFGPARTTLNAARKIQPLVNVYKGAVSSSTGFRMVSAGNLEEAKKHRELALNHFESIPKDRLMYRAIKLFRAAERESAPGPWLHAAIGLIFDAIPNAKNVSASVRFGLVDSMLYDEEVWEGYRPGFSAPVIAQVGREVRRACQFAPGPAEFLKLCQKHRASFKELAFYADKLILVRQAAEDVLIMTGDVTDEVSDDPF
jgi:hypothetical protein